MIGKRGKHTGAKRPERHDAIGRNTMVTGIIKALCLAEFPARRVR